LNFLSLLNNPRLQTEVFQIPALNKHKQRYTQLNLTASIRGRQIYFSFKMMVTLERMNANASERILIEAYVCQRDGMPV
jgi:hypothetical protein